MTIEATNSAPDAKRRWLRILDAAGPFLGLGLVLAVFGILQPDKFATPENARNVVTQAAGVAVCALGATVVAISGGIDLSVGSIISVTCVVTALLLKAGWAPLAASAAGVAAGGLCGLINGVLVTTLRIVPFIVTLGTLMIYAGIAVWLGGNQPVRAVPPWSKGVEEPAWFYHIVSVRPPEGLDWMMLAPGVWLTLLLAVATAALLRYTVLGRHIFAVGSNEATARLCGVRVERTKILVYTLGGLMAGVAGVLLLGETKTGEIKGGEGRELSVIAAVVIGGGSLAGGEGSVLGTLIGALLVRSLTNGCNLANIGSSYQQMLIGVLIIAAVTIDQVRQRRRAAG